MIQLPPKNGL